MGIKQPDMFHGMVKDELAIELIKAYEPPDGYYVAFSGGKDSVVILDLVKRAGVKYDAHYCVSPIDPIELHQFIKQFFPEVSWDYHAKGFWKLVHKKGLPLRQARWCCSIIKEGGGNDRIKILGMRKQESSRRSYYNCAMKPRNHPDSFWLLPIVNWSYDEVWEYIKVNNLPYSALYNMGFKRLGCVLCPFSSNTSLEIQSFPKIAKLWRLACDHIVERRLREGKGFKRGFTTGQELWDWWISRK